MYYYKNQDANHSIALIAENADGDIVHFYGITSDGEVQRNIGLMSWETVGSYSKATNIITVTKDRKSNCRILRKFGYVVK
jgi:hypothetical protein